METYIFDAVRTPTGAYGGGLADIRPDDLAAQTIKALLSRNKSLEPKEIGDVFLGNANGAGEENRNVARMATLLAGMPTSVPGVTVNRLCGSGLEAVIQGHRAVKVGDINVAIAGGVESMSRAPYVLAKPSRAFPRTSETLHSTTLGWRFTNPRMRDEWTISLGSSAEILAEKYQISREEQDEFALSSHQKALNAWEKGWFDEETFIPEGSELARDENIRPDTSMPALAKLRPAFKAAGTVTGGNSSPLNDGASAVLIGNDIAKSQFSLEPLAKIISVGVSGVDPEVFGIGPVEASNIALARAGLGWKDLAQVELNEAFAAQTLACVKLGPEINRDTLNIQGGAIALGHALGSSGSRLIATIVHSLRRRGGGYGLVTLCIGVGQGVALVLEV